ncbi:hypothetical protein B4N84_07850 [Flavobacterium sp. IR1]|nr:hypothetical protein B4N84_07850 [Flavobacterium sp. IR1]
MPCSWQYNRAGENGKTNIIFLKQIIRCPKRFVIINLDKSCPAGFFPAVFVFNLKPSRADVKQSVKWDADLIFFCLTAYKLVLLPDENKRRNNSGRR